MSEGCHLCYAERDSKRFGFDIWGKDAPRRFFSDKHWNEPLKWNRKAAEEGVRRRVFTASMSDVFEDREELVPWRARLWELMEKTTNLDWLVLTKRPENIVRLAPPNAWHPNIWLGVTAENERRWNERVPVLREIPAAVRFVSAEPLLSDMNVDMNGVHWVIVGGESGFGARRTDPRWFTNLLRQCREANVAYFFKQKGEVLAREMKCRDRMGKDPSEWPAEFRVQEFPGVAA